MGSIKTLQTDAMLAVNVPRGSSAQSISSTEGPRGAIQEKLAALAIPVPRAQLQGRMAELGALVGGPREVITDSSGGGFAGIRMPAARLIILGTACDRPLLYRESEELQQAIGASIAITRREQDSDLPALVTFDLLMPGCSWLERYCLWQEAAGVRYWLVPSEGEGKSALLSPWGLDLIHRAPFYSLEEREAGFRQAAASLEALRERL